MTISDTPAEITVTNTFTAPPTVVAPGGEETTQKGGSTGPSTTPAAPAPAAPADTSASATPNSAKSEGGLAVTGGESPIAAAVAGFGLLLAAGGIWSLSRRAPRTAGRV
ncbi:LPXTG cell wall anchor domain-containing protein [Leucobacter insecticola]|uniref:LPXTG cell wall anchor domain-containing protein n=1 Tax=Leucobacter insecticola TaxID=2714934 RepID=A0A6G8FHT0_9MICO|nr:LPXTG cell wall anchor domain-containing protein [Leucobacter insecticola]QIM15839.1 LPXTG cell wall anchor domain-containing protein [Leucobacter insecticola]